MVQGNRCSVTFRNHDTSLIQNILSEDLLFNYCDETASSNDSKNGINYIYNDNGKTNSPVNNSTPHSNTNTTHKAAAVQACVRFHHENMVSKIRIMMAKLTVFVNYGKIPYEKYISEAKEVLKSDSTSTSTSSSSMQENRTGKGTESGSGTEVGAGKGTVIVTCNTPIASDLKSLRFSYSEGE